MALANFWHSAFLVDFMDSSSSKSIWSKQNYRIL